MRDLSSSSRVEMANCVRAEIGRVCHAELFSAAAHPGRPGRAGQCSMCTSDIGASQGIDRQEFRCGVL